MSNTLKAVGIIIAIFGGLAYFSSMYALQSDAAKMSLPEYYSLPHFMKSAKVVVGELVVLGIGLAILIIGIRACRST